MPPDWPVWRKAGTEDVTVPGSSWEEGTHVGLNPVWLLPVSPTLAKV